MTVIAALELLAGSWVVFATVALAAEPMGPCDVQSALLLDGGVYSPAVKSRLVPDPNTFLVVPLMTGVALDRPQTIQVACQATVDGVFSQQSTITAIQVGSVERIRDQYLGGPIGPALGGPLD